MKNIGKATIAFLLCVLAGLSIEFAANEEAIQPVRPPVTAPHPPVDVQLPAPPVAPIRAEVPGFVHTLEQATMPFYINVGGGVRFGCTATVIEKNKEGYVILTARHCVEGMKEFFVMPDEKADAPYLRATVLVSGGPDTDAALLQIKSDKDFPVVPLGDERLVDIASKVEYVGFPQNLGKLYFQGYVSANKIGPPAYDEPEWNGDLGLTIQIGHGSSGSALVDPNQQAIIGVMTGITRRIPEGGNMLAMATPASKVRKMLSDYQNGVVQIQPKQLELFDLFFRRHS